MRLRAVIRYDGGFLLRNASVPQRAPRILANLIPLFLEVPVCLNAFIIDCYLCMELIC